MSVAVAPRVPEALAKRRSDCPLCPHKVEKGDPIKRPSLALDWMHADCAADYLEVYTDDEETGSPADGGWDG